jgi:hypothetical protein
MAASRPTGVLKRGRRKEPEDDIDLVSAARKRDILQQARLDHFLWLLDHVRQPPPPLTRGMVRQLLAETGAPPVFVFSPASGQARRRAPPPPRKHSRSASKTPKRPPTLPPPPIGGSLVEYLRSITSSAERGAELVDTTRAVAAALGHNQRQHSSPLPSPKALSPAEAPPPSDDAINASEMRALWRQAVAPQPSNSAAIASLVAATPPRVPLRPSTPQWNKVPTATLGEARFSTPVRQSRRSMSLAASTPDDRLAFVDLAIDHATHTADDSANPSVDESIPDIPPDLLAFISDTKVDLSSPQRQRALRALIECPFASTIATCESGAILTEIRRFVDATLELAQSASDTQAAADSKSLPTLDEDAIARQNEASPQKRPPPLDVEEGGLVDGKHVRAFYKHIREYVAASPLFKQAFQDHQDEQMRATKGQFVVPSDQAAELDTALRLAAITGTTPKKLNLYQRRAVAALKWPKVLAGIERVVMAALKSTLYPANHAAKHAAQHLRARAWALAWIGPDELDFQRPPPQVKQGLLLARDCLRATHTFTSPTDMVECLAAACTAVSASIEAASQMQGKTDVGADDILPCIIWTVLRAGDACNATLATDLMFMGRYCPAAALRDHRGYFFTSILSAAEFCRAADARTLKLDPSDMERRMRSAHRQALIKSKRGAARGLAQEEGRAKHAGSYPDSDEESDVGSAIQSPLNTPLAAEPEQVDTPEVHLARAVGPLAARVARLTHHAVGKASLPPWVRSTVMGDGESVHSDDEDEVVSEGSTLPILPDSISEAERTGDVLCAALEAFSGAAALKLSPSERLAALAKAAGDAAALIDTLKISPSIDPRRPVIDSRSRLLVLSRAKTWIDNADHQLSKAASLTAPPVHDPGLPPEPGTLLGLMEAYSRSVAWLEKALQSV